MNIEIIGTQFVNKGAELMLLTILTQLKKTHSKSKICMLTNNLAPSYKLLDYGIFIKIPHIKKGINIKFIGFCIPKKIRDYCNFIIDQELDVILDASGFAYSDQWGESSARNIAASIDGWKKQGTKVIILPQAFGPFTSDKLINNMKKVISKADLIFARDETSYNYLTKLSDGKLKNIKLAPDFTNLLNFKPIENFEYKDYICITPNKRMLDKSKKGVEYLNLLSNMIKKLEEKNQHYFFLIHEGIHDRDVIKKLNITKSPQIIQTEDVVEIKQILGSVKGVIGSRFHGLVSALSQGIPSIAIGWSHKYEELFKDYDCYEHFIDLNKSIDIEKVLKVFLNKDLYLKTKNKLHSQSILLKKKSENMWNDVLDTIKE